MKIIDVPSKKRVLSKLRILSLMFVSLVVMVSCFAYHKYYNTYKSIKVVLKDNAAIEYGNANYDIKNLIEEVDGEIVSVKTGIDTSVMGEQEMIVEVKKNNVLKDVSIIVPVVDTVAPVINIKEEKVTITQGDQIDFNNNVSSVDDAVDGAISYLNEVNEDSTYYYNFDYNSEEIKNVGNHEVVVKAIDKYGNIATTSFIVEVVAPVVTPVASTNNNTNNNVAVPQQQEPIYSDVAPNAQGNDLVSIAYSLIGSPYVAGANGPNAFDCSGFVQYVYSRVGISVSRSSSTQIHDGVGVSYESAAPGDILSWGYGNTPSHSALYIGNGKMIHATNPRQGVIESDVAAWTRGSGMHVIAVRRIK